MIHITMLDPPKREGNRRNQAKNANFDRMFGIGAEVLWKQVRGAHQSKDSNQKADQVDLLEAATEQVPAHINHDARR